MRKITDIFLHCSANQSKDYIDAEFIRKYHVGTLGWSDIGYHYVIKVDGTVEKGRPLHIAGAHTKGYNKFSIGVCLIGGINAEGEAEDNFTHVQFDSLAELLKQLLIEHPTIKRIRGHCDVANKACPVFDVKEFLEKANIKV